MEDLQLKMEQNGTAMTDSDVEKARAASISHVEESTKGSQLQETHPQVDKKTGAILSPQPTDDPNDPLNWPQWAKWLILGQVALGAFQTPFNNAITVGTLGPLAKQWDVSVTYVSYLLSISLVPNAIGVSIFHSCELFNEIREDMRLLYKNDS
jgi:hypothetical protein